MDNKKTLEQIRKMTQEEFYDYLININKSLRNIEENEEVIADAMEAGDLVSPTLPVRNQILTELFENIKNMEDVDSIAAMTYYTLINLHMFSDGNGRTSRFIYDSIKGNITSSNMGYYYHKDSGMIDEKKDDFERKNGIEDPSVINRVPDMFLREQVDFIPKDILKKYAWICAGSNPNAKSISEIIPKDIQNNLTKEEISELNIILSDSLGSLLTPSGIALTYVCQKKNELEKWENLPINSQETQNIIGVSRLCFPIFRKPELISDWSLDDFKDIIKVGNYVKYMRLKTTMDIFKNPQKYIDPDTNQPIISELINLNNSKIDQLEEMLNDKTYEQQEIMKNNFTL